MNAYAVIPHPARGVFADFNRDTSQVMTIDTVGISIYQVSTPILTLYPIDPADMGK